MLISISRSSDGHFGLLHDVADSSGGQQPRHLESPRESPAALCEVETLGARMHVGPSPFLSHWAVGDQFGSRRHDAQQVVLIGTHPTAHTGALGRGSDHHHDYLSLRVTSRLATDVTAGVARWVCPPGQ